MSTRNFPGIELARTGTFEASTGRLTLTTKDFDEAEKAYKALREQHHAVIKLGHDEHQELLQADGFPNAGFLENIRRTGDRLVADFIEVPEVVAKLIDAGRYRARSIEAMRNFEVDGKKWPFVITGVALLGADLPAVDSLKDIAQLYASHGLDVPDGAQAVLILAEADEGESLIAEFDDILTRAETIIKRRGGAPTLRTLANVFKSQLRAISRARPKQQEDKELDIKKIIDLLGLPEDTQEEQAMAKLAEMKAKADKPDPEPDPEPKDPEPVPAIAAELADARKRILVLETEQAKDKATTEVDQAIKARKFVPASRDTLIKMAMSSPTEFGDLVKSTPENAILAKTGELGSDNDGDTGIPADLEPTAQEMQIAKQVGNTREDIIAAKAQRLGQTVPAEVAQVLAARNK